MLLKNYLLAEVEFRAATIDMPGDLEAMRLLREAQTGQAKKTSYDRHMSAGKAALSGKNFVLAESEFRAASLDMPGDLEAMRLLGEAQRARAKR
jgi:hypothetical protein